MKNMKNSRLWRGLLAAGVVLLASNVFAGAPPPTAVPDAGSSALLLALSVLGIGAVRKFATKK